MPSGATAVLQSVRSGARMPWGATAVLQIEWLVPLHAAECCCHGFLQVFCVLRGSTLSLGAGLKKESTLAI